MKKIKKNEMLKKNPLFLLNNSNKNNNTTYLSFLKNHINIQSKNKENRKSYFRNSNSIKHSQLQTYLLRLGYLSYEKNSNIKSKSKLKNLNDTNASKTPFQGINNNSTKLSKRNYRILKEIFPNLSEIKLYSNFPLYPFTEKDYNKKIIKKQKKNIDIKKKIYNFYCRKDDIDDLDLKIVPDDINNAIDNHKEEKTKSSNFNQFKFIQNKRINMNLSRKNIKSYLEENLPLKIAKFNLNKKFIFPKNEVNNLNKNTFIDIFKNEEIIKYFKIENLLPNVNQKEDNNYKFVKIKKNNSFVNSNNCVNNNKSEKATKKKNYSFSHQTIKIKSVLSRNKIISYKNNIKYEDKGTNTNEL